tara:strand:- start:322 stop:609 length:288 start_codon:yes stop_codon:yes gene_type:complete
MDNSTYLTILLPTIFFLTSFFNLTILSYLLFKINKNSTERAFGLNTKEFELLQRQYLFLQVRTEVESKRLEAIEKIISAMVVSSYSGGDDGGVMH